MRDTGPLINAVLGVNLEQDRLSNLPRMYSLISIRNKNRRLGYKLSNKNSFTVGQSYFHFYAQDTFTNIYLK